MVDWNQFINDKWKRILTVLGVVLFIIGTLDPMEGSVLILAGAVLISSIRFMDKKENWKLFCGATFCIIAGIFFLFYISSLGGIGGASALSWWYGLLILPYPIGWLTIVVLLISRAIKNRKLKQ